MKFRQWMLAAAAVAALAGQAAIAAPQARWTLTQIPSLAGVGSSSPLGINNHGQIVGTSTALDPVQTTAMHAFMWDNGTMIDLGRTPTNFPISLARAINDGGTVLGADGLGVPFTWSDGTWTALPVIGQYRAINKFGALGGSYASAFGGTHGFIYRDGVLTDVGTLGGPYSSLDGLNDKGLAVGRSLTTANQMHPYLYEAGTIRDLGTFGGTFGAALGINSHGVVVGAANDAANQQFAFIYDGGSIRRLFPDSTLQSQANGINDHGAVIGWFESGPGLAFVYDSGVLTMLDQIPEVQAAGLTWLVPTGINDRGWIIGNARKGLASVGFVLVPK
jgi:probable HAF family extracellular repeat protein